MRLLHGEENYEGGEVPTRRRMGRWNECEREEGAREDPQMLGKMELTWMHKEPTWEAYGAYKFF